MNVRRNARTLVCLISLLALGMTAPLAGCGNPNPRVIRLGSGGTVGLGSGGTVGTGGLVGTGGVTSSGGVVGSGGVAGTGGGVGSGGAGTAGAAGGSIGSGGGAKGPGGETASGGAAGGLGSGGAAGGATGSGGVTGGPNLITNGDFSMGDMFWSIDVSSVAHQITAGADCLMITGGSATLHLGWPAMVAQALNLAAGTYALSYRASSSGPLTVMIQPKVGLAVDPYTADFPNGSAVTDAVGATLQTFTHMFTIAAADTKAGLAFTIVPGGGSQTTTVCFDDVSLVKQ